MLSKDFLNAQYLRLYTEYGSNVYGKERIRLLHESLGDITEKDLEKLISKLIKKCLKPPLENEFLKYYSEVREENRLEEVRKNNLENSFAKTNLGSVGSSIAKEFSFQELFVKMAEIQFKSEAKWKEDHRKRLATGEKPHFRIGDFKDNIYNFDS